MMDWNSAIYGSCSLGKQKHFWAAWRSADAWYDGDRPFASGYEASRGRAEERGRDAISGLVAAPDAQRMRVGHVAHCHRRLASETRMQKPPQTQGTANREFLYSFWWNEEGEQCVSHYRIVKKTQTRIYVDAESYRSRNYSDEDAQWWRFDIKTAVVDRATIEREGEAWCPGLRTRLQVNPTSPSSSHAPPCLETLGLRPPCAEADVKRAFRALSKEAHPDAGGETARFIELQRAYEQALQYVQHVSAQAA